MTLWEWVRRVFTEDVGTALTLLFTIFSGLFLGASRKIKRDIHDMIDARVETAMVNHEQESTRMTEEFKQSIQSSFEQLHTRHDSLTAQIVDLGKHVAEINGFLRGRDGTPPKYPKPPRKDD